MGNTSYGSQLIFDGRESGTHWKRTHTGPLKTTTLTYTMLLLSPPVRCLLLRSVVVIPGKWSRRHPSWIIEADRIVPGFTIGFRPVVRDA
jgi:hypothetical protein